jgi:hypothetical protein
MDASSLTATTFSVKDAQGNLIPGTISHTGTTATFIPSVALAPSSSYLATITAGVIDLARNALPTDYFWPFATGTVPDTTPPMVVSTNPVNGANGVPVNTTVTATFSEAMDASSVNTTTFTVKDPANNPVPGVVTYSGKTATVTPSANLAFSTTYTVAVTTGVKDLAGNNLAGDYIWTFSSGASPPPPSGSLVSEFGSGGVLTVNLSLFADGAFAALIDDNALFVVGSDESVGPQWHIEKRNLTTGSLVTAFGTGGVITSNLSSGYDSATKIVSDGTHLYVVGYDMVPGFGDYEWRIEKRLLITGGLVNAFGNNGVVTVNPHSGGGPDADIPNSVAIDGTSLYVTGTGNLQSRIEKRSLSTGELDTNFGTGGVLMSIGVLSWPLIQTRDSSLYIIGTITTPQGNHWRIEKRSRSTGDLITDFGANGVVTSDLFSGRVYAAAADADHLYVVGEGYAASGSGDSWWRIEKRSLNTGDLVTTFGSGGVVSSNPSPDDDEAHAVVLDGGNFYVVGDDNSLAGYNLQWRIEKRSLTSGALIEDFGSGGVVTSNQSVNQGDGYRETATDVVADATSLYVVGIDQSSGNSQWRIEKRAK